MDGRWPCEALGRPCEARGGPCETRDGQRIGADTPQQGGMCVERGVGADSLVPRVWRGMPPKNFRKVLDTLTFGSWRVVVYFRISILTENNYGRYHCYQKQSKN
jgi:hypothetical protein